MVSADDCAAISEFYDFQGKPKYWEKYVRFEVFMAVTMKKGVFWDVTPRGSCKN
jgi:hypothetical protein